METTMEIIDKNTLVANHIDKGISYEDYRAMVSKHVAEGTSTGPTQTEALSQYTLLNDSRMRRLDKTTKVSKEITEKFENFKGNQTWIVLTESWCGDAAQTMPAMQKLAVLNDGIELKVLLRDDNLELMDQFLTNGGMSIPKLIIFDNDRNEVIADWGPRPSIATTMVNDYKEKNGALTPEFKKDLQVWYNRDKSQNTLNDLSQLIS